MKEKLTAQVVVRLPEDLLARVEYVAEHDERTVAQTIRLAIKRYLDRESKEHV